MGPNWTLENWYSISQHFQVNLSLNKVCRSTAGGVRSESWLVVVVGGWGGGGKHPLPSTLSISSLFTAALPLNALRFYHSALRNMFSTTLLCSLKDWSQCDVLSTVILFCLISTEESEKGLLSAASLSNKIKLCSKQFMCLLKK